MKEKSGTKLKSIKARTNPVPTPSANNKTSLPAGWVLCKLEDLLDYVQPTDYIVESTDYRDNYKTPVLTPGKSFIKGYTKETKGIFKDLPVIIFDDFTTANKFVNFPFKVKSSAMKILKPKTGSNIMFAFYFMQTLKVSTDTHKRYWISVYSKLGVPLPPPKEQQAIVSKIEELLSELDKGKQQLETAQQQLKVYRQAVLKWAFEGKLLSSGGKWNFKLFKDSLKFSQGIQVDVNLQKAEKGDNQQVRFLRIIDFTQGNDAPRYIDNPGERYLVNKDEISLVRYGASTGFVCTGLAGAIANNLFKVKPDHNIVSKFLYYFLLGPSFQNVIAQSIKGAAMPAISFGLINNVIFPIPSLDEQQLIVQEIESRLSVCDKVEETITTSLAQAETLRQSILKKAFEGRLI